jgi:hypothetical protein
MNKSRKELLAGMSYAEKCAYYAGGRAAVKPITQVVNGGLVTRYAGYVRGVAVRRSGQWLFDTQDEAREAAKKFIAECRAVDNA